MNDTENALITRERNVRTHAELWHTSQVLYYYGVNEEKGSMHLFRASIVFTAFTFEAYLNHIGPKIFRFWKSLERLSPKDKLNVIAEKIDLEIDYGKRPWQIMKKLFGFRNDIAHGKSEVKVDEKVVLVEKLNNKEMYAFIETEWEMFCTEKNAKRSRDDVFNMAVKIHDATGLVGDAPFLFGMQSSQTTKMK